MNIIIYLRDVVVSLISNLGFSAVVTVSLADVSLIAIALGLLIAAPELALAVILLVLLIYR